MAATRTPPCPPPAAWRAPVDRQGALPDPAGRLARLRVDRRALARRGLLGLGLGAAALVVYLVVGGSTRALADALLRALQADWRWVALGVAFEVASFAGYVLLFRALLGDGSPRLGLRASAAITFAAAAVTRLLPTAGLGGAGLTVWALRRAGLALREATERLVALFVVLYGVYMVALLVTGGGLATGLLPGAAPPAVALPAAAFGVLVIVLALVLAARAPRRGPLGQVAATRAWRSQVGPALGAGLRRGLRQLRRGDPRLAGAAAWWAFDIAVLWATLEAFGEPLPPAAATLAYFAGSLANLLPVPGAVATGMVGVHVAFGVPVEAAVPAVLAYRAIALWLPAAGGLVALAQLRGLVRCWAWQDAAQPRPPAAREAR